ncbi:hypothetical protein WICPIJ_001786 [Wickerhamomyces pijperi]|uniref:Uncharacterized protein n=1 Tax=Wickerhamomyces pijperi TaxID=599730 RepID=A0A9P8TQG0_WICPI|nr:hypothetical protein WICPIJ_001786 [Wickerhamomyces pijperi]
MPSLFKSLMHSITGAKSYASQHTNLLHHSQTWLNMNALAATHKSQYQTEKSISEGADNSKDISSKRSTSSNDNNESNDSNDKNSTLKSSMLVIMPLFFTLFSTFSIFPIFKTTTIVNDHSKPGTMDSSSLCLDAFIWGGMGIVWAWSYLDMIC